MIVYFADRMMNIRGQASTTLMLGFQIVSDRKFEDVDTGVAAFECSISFDKSNRLLLEEMTNAGNYLLRSCDGENEFYTIIDSEIDTKKKEVYIYAEDAGLDLLNEIAGEFEATETKTIDFYINKWINDSGFEIGINEVPKSTTRKLSWTGETSVTDRLASIATQFGGYEISYSFAVKGMEISRKYVNIHKTRGQYNGIQLRLNRDIDRIITTKSVANLATAFVVTGGTPDNADKPITLRGYEYDDGDFYVGSDGVLRSRKAVEKWSRYIWNKEPNMQANAAGHIWKTYSYDTTNQATLCAHAITELKKICDMEVNFEIELKRLPDDVRIGDRVDIVDNAGKLYVSTRILKLETSEVDKEQKATLGDHLIKNSGISQKVADLAANFAAMTISVKRAQAVASSAQITASEAQEKASSALAQAESAQTTASKAESKAETATQSAENAQAKALAAEAAVNKVEESVSSIETTVNNAKAAADNAYKAAETAQAKANEAAQNASNAQSDAKAAQTAAGEAKTAAESAVAKAETAQGTATTAISTAETASTTAAAAKIDAEKAKEDIATFENSLETLEKTMTADYARKTELTKTSESLRTAIQANANEISITNQKVVTIDETANSAKETAEAAQTAADLAKTQADSATADASAAQAAADTAAQAAADAQAEATNAANAAATAQSVADKAKNDLATAQADLATVQTRVGATEEEIAAAQAAVTAAQAAADKAQSDATAAETAAQAAQAKANTASDNATAAQTAADEAANKATQAQQVANEAKGNAEAAKNTADQAAAAAEAAQQTADTAKSNATAAQTKANEAATAAANAKAAADSADEKAAQAQSDLDTAKQNLKDVTSRVGATESEVAAAQAAVATAQAAADEAKTNASNAKTAAEAAAAEAAAAQSTADTAKTAADNAQEAADAAKAAADKAQKDVDSLTVRTTTAETNITKNAEEIALRAKKTEVAETLGGYYTKKESDAQIQTISTAITTTVKSEFKRIKIGARNILLDSACLSKYYSTGYKSTVNQVVAEDNSIPSGQYRYVYFKTDSEAETTKGFRFLGSDMLSSLHQMKKDKTYTLSFYMRYYKDDNLSVPGDFVRACAVYAGLLASDNTQEVPITYDSDLCEIPAMSEIWQKYVITFTVTDDPTDFGLRFYFSNMSASKEYIIHISSIMLEEGNKATDWTPSPEDMATSDELFEAEKNASDALTKASSAETIANQLADSFNYLVKSDSGGSYFRQDESGNWYFTSSDNEKAISDIADTLDKMKEASEEELAALKAKLDELSKLSNYIRLSTDGEQPYIELGQKDSEYKTKITNTDIKYFYGTIVLAVFDTEGLKADKVSVKSELNAVGVVFRKKANGYVGVGLLRGVNDGIVSN